MLRSVREKKALLVGDDKKQALAQVEQLLVRRLIEATSESQFLALAAVVRQEMEVGMRQGGLFVIFKIFVSGDIITASDDLRWFWR
jgi:hypothetical protein